MKKVSVIILNWNGWKMTLDCLESLVSSIKPASLAARQSGYQVLSMEIIVVDNGSTDDSVERIKKYLIHNTKYLIHLIENRANLGFAGGNNVGIKYALENGADYVCLLNNDTRVDPNFITELVKTAESDEKIGLVGGKIYFEKGYEFHKERYKNEELGKVIWYAGGLIDWNNVYTTHRGVDEVDSRQFEVEVETDYVNGCLALIKREVFEKIGLFNPQYFLYFEDADLSVRAKKAGYKLFYCPTAKIWHLNSGSSASGSGLHDYYMTRNRMLFVMKYAPLRAKIALLRESLKLLKSGREWQKKGIRDFYLGKFGKGSFDI